MKFPEFWIKTRRLSAL